MAIERNFTGFEFGDYGELTYGSGGTSLTAVSTSSPRSGAFVMNRTCLSGGSGMAYFPAGTIVGTTGTVSSGNHKRVSVRAYFRPSNPQNNGQMRIFGFGDDNGTCTVYFGAQNIGGFVQSGAKIGLRIGTQSHNQGTAGAYPWGTVDLTLSVWYRLLLDIDLDVAGTTVLSATLRITSDTDSPAIDFTLTNSLNIGASDNIDKLGFGYSVAPGGFGKRIDTDWDDILYIATSDSDAVSGQPTLLTQTHIYAIVPPTGEVSNQWSGTFADVDEYPLSGSTMSSSTALAEVEFSHASGIALGYRSVEAIKLYVNALVSGAGTGSVDYMLNGVAKNVTLGANYPGAPTAGVDPIGGILWSTLTAAQFSAIAFGIKKQNSTQATVMANIGIEIIGTLASSDDAAGTQIRGETQIKEGSIYGAQIADFAGIRRTSIEGGALPIFVDAQGGGGGDDGLPGPPGAAGAAGAAGATGATGATGSAGLPGGALVLLASLTASASASLDFASRNEGGLTGAIFQSDYDEYVFEFINILAATSTTVLTMRVSTNGGSSYISASDYRWAYNFGGSAAGTGIANSNSATSITIAGSLGNSSSQGAIGQLRISDPLGTSKSKLCQFSAGFQSSDSNWYHLHGAGVYNQTTAVNAVQFLMASGNITSGIVRCYGVAKTGTPIPAIVTSAFSSRPAAAVDGKLFMPSDGFQIERDTSAAWVPWGPIFPLTVPSDSGFAWVNQGSATLVTTRDALVLNCPGHATVPSVTMRVKTAPATPYVITACLLGNPISKSFLSYGLIFRQSSDGKLVYFRVVGNTTTPVALGVDKFTSATAYSANYQNFYLAKNPPWLRIADNGSNRICSFSMNGQDWTQFHSVGRTDFLTADQIGFAVEAGNSVTPNLDSLVTVISWLQT